MQHKESVIFKVVPYFIGFVFLLVLAGIAVQIYLAVFVVQEVNEHGLKSIVEEIWDGPDKDGVPK